MALTNDDLRKNAKINNFELTLYAIQLGRYEIGSGREANLSRILQLVDQHPDPSYMDHLRAVDQMEDE